MLKCSEWVKPSSHVRWFCCRIVGRVTTLAHNPQDYEIETFRLSYYNPFRAAEVRHFQQLVESELCKSVFGTSRYKRQRRQGLAQLSNFVSWRLPAASIEYFINCLSTTNFERCFHRRNYFWVLCLVSSAAFSLCLFLNCWSGWERKDVKTLRKKSSPKKMKRGPYEKVSTCV